MTQIHQPLEKSSLGKKSTYLSQYQPDLLFPVCRQEKREELGITGALPFKGSDIWNAYEISWLNPKGKPIAATGEFIFPCETSHLIESKSFKLYLNSFNNTQFASFSEVETILKQDLSKACGSPITIKLHPLLKITDKVIRHFEGICLDDLDITCDTYEITPTLLQLGKGRVREILYSDLLKSNCLVTGQPDWASIQITYTGKSIQHESLLKYLVSYRNHNEFHEQCVERIFTDIIRQCAPEKLLVSARYTRRGGLDINPYRANYAIQLPNIRLWRQ